MTMTTQPPNTTNQRNRGVLSARQSIRRAAAAVVVSGALAAGALVTGGLTPSGSSHPVGAAPAPAVAGVQLAASASRLPCWRHDGHGCDNKSFRGGLRDASRGTGKMYRDAGECAGKSVAKSLWKNRKKPNMASLALGTIKPGIKCGRSKGY